MIKNGAPPPLPGRPRAGNAALPASAVCLVTLVVTLGVGLRLAGLSLEAIVATMTACGLLGVDLVRRLVTALGSAPEDREE